MLVGRGLESALGKLADCFALLLTFSLLEIYMWPGVQVASRVWMGMRETNGCIQCGSDLAEIETRESETMR